MIEDPGFTPRFLFVYFLLTYIPKGVSLSLDPRILNPTEFFLFLWDDDRATRCKSLPFRIVYFGFLFYEVLISWIFSSLLPILVWTAHPQVQPAMKLVYVLYVAWLVGNCFKFLFDPRCRSIDLPGYPRIFRAELEQ